MKAQSFMRGAVILTTAGLISKLLGAAYRIPFFRVVGSEGMGLYQMAYPLYTMLLAVSSAGIPVAVSKLVAEKLAYRNLAQANRVFRISLIFIALVSGAASIILYIGAPYLAERVLHDARAYYSIAAISPAVFLVGIMSVFRGYFQGFQEMGPTACSQVLEQFFRVGTVLAGAYIFLPRGVEFAAAAATFGAVTGAMAGVIFVAGLYYIRPNYRSSSPGPGWGFSGNSPGTIPILYRVIVLALPISLGSMVMPVMQTLDALTVPGRLQLAGYSVSRATQLYGELTGGAVTLINLPTVITISLAASLVPAISGLFERKNYFDLRGQAKAAIDITLVVCLPAAAGLAVLAAPISDLLFKCPEAGLPLRYLAPAAVFLGLHQTTSGVLQGMGRTFIPVMNLVIGAVIKFGANYLLTPIPHIGIVGAALGTVSGFMTSSFLNYLFIRRFIGWQPNYHIMLLKPLAAATIMAAAVYFIYGHTKIVTGGSLATVISIFTGILLYAAVLSWSGAFRDLGVPGPVRILRRIIRIR